MRERIGLPDATAQLIQQLHAGSISIVAGLVQQDADTCMGEVSIKMVTAITQHE